MIWLIDIIFEFKICIHFSKNVNDYVIARMAHRLPDPASTLIVGWDISIFGTFICMIFLFFHAIFGFVSLCSSLIKFLFASRRERI